MFDIIGKAVVGLVAFAIIVSLVRCFSCEGDVTYVRRVDRIAYDRDLTYDAEKDVCYGVPIYRGRGSGGVANYDTIPSDC